MATKEQTWQETVGDELANYWWAGEKPRSGGGAYWDLKGQGMTVEDVVAQGMRERFRSALDEAALARQLDEKNKKSWVKRHLLAPIRTRHGRAYEPTPVWTAWFFEHVDSPKLWTEETPGDWYFDYDEAMKKIASPAVRKSLVDTAIAQGWIDLDDAVEPRFLAEYRARLDPRQMKLAFNKRSSRRPKRTSRGRA